MGDNIKNLEIFKKLGFGSSDQWILYEETFQPFFNWFAENITDENIIQDNEILEAEELKKSGEFVYGHELELQLTSLNESFPSILDSTEDDVSQLEAEIEYLSKAELLYADLINDMESTKSAINRDLISLEAENNELDNQEKIAYQNSVQKAKILQELQKENWKLCAELNECFVKVQTPPLFIHEMPLDQYCQKCDSFLQYLTNYMKDNFNIQDFMVELDESEIGDPKMNIQLEQIRILMFGSETKYIKNKMKSLAVQQMIDELDINRIHHASLPQLKKETRDMETMNRHNTETRFEYIMEYLNKQLEEIAQQQVEMVLFENSKKKFERGKKRLENVKYHSNIVSEALSNAELLWMLMQLDLEKVKNNFNNTDQLFDESKKCIKRIESMRISQSGSLNNLVEDFIKKIMNILPQNISFNKLNSIKSCLYEYEKFCRSSKYIIEGILYHKHYSNVLDTFGILDSLDKVLSVYVFNAPVNRPMLENIKYLKAVFKGKKNKTSIERNMKSLRTQFNDNVLERTKSERLWRYKQNLWIWFLTEPKKVLTAIEEASKVAANIPAVKMKPLSGLKRM